jgi:hypothetical protein
MLVDQVRTALDQLGTSIETADPNVIAYALCECDLELDFCRVRDLTPIITEWQAEQRQLAAWQFGETTFTRAQLLAGLRAHA